MEKVDLTDFFTISASLQDDKMRFIEASINDVDALPFVSRTARNNGVTAYCLPKEGKINPGGVITLALDGSTGATFYQHYPFLSGQNIWVLTHNESKFPEWNPQIALFCVASISKAVAAYTYNLSLTKTRLKNIQIKLPLGAKGNVDIQAIEDAMSAVRHVELLKELPEERFQILT